MYGSSTDLYLFITFFQLTPGTKHIAVIISPLNALMHDQAEMFSRHGIKCASINSESGLDLRTLDFNKFDILLLTPEQALSSKFRVRLDIKLKRKLCLIALDEAHCVTQWGQTAFRPEYAQMADFLAVIPETPVLVLTATMSKSMEITTMTALYLSSYITVAISPDRPEIYLDIKPYAVGCLQWLIDELLIKQNQCDKSVIYCRSIKQVMFVYETILHALKERVHVPSDKKTGENRLVEQFSASVDPSVKKRVLRLFPLNANLRVVVTTVAFGMGINISDIRNVILWGVPESYCHFWQQVGRGCRDGKNGQAVVYLYRVPNSLTTSSELKETLRPSLNQCVRLEVLKQLWLPAMGELPVKGPKCMLSCLCCKCAYCLCCMFCRSVCPCRAM